MKIARRVLVPGDLDEDSYADYPGMRVYAHLSNGGYPLATTHTNGAVVLWNPEGSEAPPFDDEASRHALEVRYYSDPLPMGPNAEHERKAKRISIALSDGAYIAADQIWAWAQVYPHVKRNGLSLDRDAIQDVAQPHYCRWRDYLAYDCNIPYLLACLTAAHYTRHFGEPYSRRVRREFLSLPF